MNLTTTDRIIFAVVAILAAAVVALILFGCSGESFDADGGVDAAVDASDTDTDETPADAGAEPDAGVDSGGDTDTVNPCPFACTMSADACLEISGEIVNGDCPTIDGAVCCHLETWPDSGV